MSQVPVKPSDYDTGLEDFGMEDAVIPRLGIEHKRQLFKDSLNGAENSEIECIILGLVKQRVLFHNIMSDKSDDWPMCKSNDHSTGFPNLAEEQPKDKRFPWDLSGFRPEDYPEGDDGERRLPCEGCKLKDWGSHPDGKKPYCSEQFTLPILYRAAGSDDDFVPAILTFQKTSLKPLKAYLSSFARNKSAAFQVVTQIGLNAEKRGINEYSVPWFKTLEKTDEENWREFSTNYRAMREFLAADPGSRDEAEVNAPSDNTAKPPVEEKADEPVEDVVDAEVVEDKPKETVPAAAADDDDDLPF